MLSFLLLTAGPAQASPIQFADVIAQAVATSVGGRQTFDLRLRAVPQSGRTTTSGTQTQNPTGTTAEGQTVAAPGDVSSSVTNTEVQTGQTQSGNVEVVQLGDVTGTVCDCGEIFIETPGHFPKLPFLALAGIPFLFIPHGKTPPPPGETPTPTPPDTPSVPEPTTLLLLGSGLAAFSAGARRRRRDALKAASIASMPSAGEV
ncbi:MAG TPA: PEP-CTERM sorting domain-containing protein [Pyrinomonadaceae bacterium]|jgi:hypothetical protein